MLEQGINKCLLATYWQWKDDSLDGIYNTVKDCAMISKFAGGIGLHVHNVRLKEVIYVEQMAPQLDLFLCSCS